MDTSVPAVVLGLHYGGVGVARSLGRLGVPVYGVDYDARAPGVACRYCREAHIWDLTQGAVSDTLTFLDDLGRRLGHAVLIPATDTAPVFVAEHADELAHRFLFPRPAPGLVGALTDKREMFGLANRFGIPTPATVFPRSRDEVLQFLSHASFPIVLKGIDAARLERRTGRRLAIVHDAQQLLRRYREWEEPGAPNLMLQEYIPGGDECIWMFNGYFDDRSECVAAFTGRKLRQHPEHGGTTSLGMCQRNEMVERLTVGFMQALGYRGPLDVDYSYDRRDGLYKLLDPNPRVGATFRLFVDERGMDVARFLYLGLTGQPAEQARMRDGRKWIVEDRDLESSLASAREGTLTLRRWLGSLRGVEEAAWFARDDLGPFWRMIRQLAARVLRGATRRLRALLPRSNHATVRAREIDEHVQHVEPVGAHGLGQEAIGLVEIDRGRIDRESSQAPAEGHLVRRRDQEE